MRGTILGVHGERGVLIADGERRMEFALSEWRSAGAPAAGQVVDFIEDGGQARDVFAVPGVAHGAGAVSPSGSTLLGGIGVGCLALGFVIPIVPTIAAFVLGVIGAGQAQAERNETGLILSRISWIGALVVLAIGVLIIMAIIAFVGTLGFAAAWHGLGPVDL